MPLLRIHVHMYQRDGEPLYIARPYTHVCMTYMVANTERWEREKKRGEGGRAGRRGRVCE